MKALPLLLLILCGPVTAGDWSVGTILTATHTNQDKDYNEDNDGLCLQYSWVFGCRYRNSYDKMSNSIGAELPLSKEGSVLGSSLSFAFANSYEEETKSGVILIPALNFKADVGPATLALSVNHKIQFVTFWYHF